MSLRSDSAVRIRPAAWGDLGAINDIYNYYVLNSTASYETEPSTPAHRQVWFASHGPEHCVTVAERDGEVVGWGALSRFHPRAAYGRTVENSVYVRQDMQRQGIGSALLADLIERGRAVGHHSIVALIDGGQTPSIALHERLGFVQAGRLREVGNKFSRWLDVVYMQKML
jgi:L-amino acid N-acyltransferase YncA